MFAWDFGTCCLLYHLKAFLNKAYLNTDTMLLKHFSQGRAATCGRASSTGSSSNGVRLVQPVRGSAAKHGGEPTNHTLLQASVGLVSERSSLVPTKAALVSI
eukprot:1158892-Pelagomonas_calceolata.AAC.14